MKNPKKHVKKNKWFKYKVLAVVFVSLIVLGVYAVREVSFFIAERDSAIFRDGYEEGRFDEVNQLENETIRNNLFNELQESVRAEVKAKTQSNKDVVLAKLAQIESGNGKKRKVLDTNGRYSLGLYHFQAHTVKDLYKRYYGKKITIQEAVAIAQDDKLSTQLAHDAIFVKGEKFHWLLSMCKLGEIKKGCLTQKQINNLFAKK